MADASAYPETKARTETFSYLPQMTPERMAQQIAYCISRGWNPAIEYTEPEKSFSNFWYLWKLPFFGTQSVELVLNELEACHRANPGKHVRFIAYDNYAQSQGMAFVVYRA
ncbi:MAG: ribulose bisphosphate carboxylase small subunit [Rhodobacteraceae bacterium]|nr:ribulose bisphosphate carboxylase small subunit [Paracoccaceae bacterium]